MATVKRSVTLDEQLVTEAMAVVGKRGLSKLVNEALRRQLLLLNGARAVAEHEAEHGPVPAADLEAVDARWPR